MKYCRRTRLARTGRAASRARASRGRTAGAAAHYTGPRCAVAEFYFTLELPGGFRKGRLGSWGVSATSVTRGWMNFERVFDPLDRGEVEKKGGEIFKSAPFSLK